MILEAILFIVLAVLGGLLVYARWRYGTLEKLGIPVVKPHLFLGSSPDGHKQVSHEQDLAWFKKYGNVYGVYEGREPMVHVCDADIVKHIFVKDYEHFHSRRFIDFGDKVMNETMDIQEYEKWKSTRAMMSPIFTMSRLKNMNESMIEALDDFCAEWDAEIESTPGKRLENRNVYDNIFNMFCDLISRCVYSIKVEKDASGTSFLAKTLKEYLAPFFSREEYGYIVTLANVFPFLRGSAPILDPASSEAFINIFKNIVKDRKQSGHKKDDIISQIMLMLDKVDSEEYREKGITEFTVMAQTVIFFMAGQDQFTITITHIAYQLSQNNEVAEKLYKEIDDFLARHNGEIKHENLNELVYTNACIQESLRKVPPFSRPERTCQKDWSHNGLFIPKGTIVVAAIYPMHHNPEYFENPEAFNPDRFLPENKDKLHPFAFSAFGHGPKNCIAMRFSYEVLLISVVKLFSKYRFIATENTKLEFRKGTQFSCSPKPISLDVANRK